ncbi:MAG TPA: hypothetical protein VFA43_16835 [Gemmatimonadaceae bacterium]|nr:hypothetical protein [Gemmatimonadaceae bacterium]
MQSQRLLTAEEFAALPDDGEGRQELIRGVMSVHEPRPSLWHGWIQHKIGHLLYD